VDPRWEKDVAAVLEKLPENIRAADKWSDSHALLGVPRTRRNIALVNLTVKRAEALGLESDTLLVDLKQSCRYRAFHAGEIGCLSTRSQWFHFGRDRMLLLSECAALMGHSATVGLSRGVCGPDNKSCSDLLGNSMSLPCVGVVLAGVAILTPGVYS
jgi:hypothetical protein